ncbi:PKD domain-containing protein [Halorhabdus rudnickae]|uniref:PKD domain-containing protein n=1 Tax=Halorhabdus rudnickae TaxID=1775544 RepID=UPI001082CF71|nr:PKD domain-containing protein [Halorhabdus rudnickae]
MTWSRREVLRELSALSAVAVGATGITAAASCSGVSEYDSGATYTGGDQVVYDGALWTAEWWTSGTTPSTDAAVWTKEGSCGGDDGGSGVDCSDVSEWDSSTTYTGGDRAVYDGRLWEAKWWTQGDEPGASQRGPWKEVGACGGGGDDGGNESPTASFTVDLSAPEPGEDITFDASDSSDPDGTIASSEWDFDDGNSATGEVVTHSYGSSGDYTVTLTVTDDAGASVTASQTVSVSSDNTTPNASFRVDPSDPAPGDIVTFDAADSSDADGTVDSYEWDLGDGNSATGQTVTNSYESGEYTVTLTVTDDDGATDSNATTVVVQSDGGSGTGETTFAPYNHLATNLGTSMVEHYQQAENDAFTLAFVLSDGSGNACWDGEPDQLVADGVHKDEIQAYQNTGGEVIISFGGAVGTMIAQDTSDIETIKSEYETVMDTYGVTHLDFDIESVNKDAVDRRNQALAELQSERPELTVSYTLRCRTTGLTQHGSYVVNNAADHGVNIEYVNIMTMNYGWVEPTASTVKDSANGLHSDLSSIFSEKSSADVWNMVGVTPMIGVNNVGGSHMPSDAEEVASFATEKGVGLVAFWSIDRDNGGCADGSVSATCSGIQQGPYEFSQIYNQVQ